MEKIVISILSVIAGLFYIFCVFVFFGKGGSLIAGYNLSPKGDKAKRYHLVVMRAYSIFLFLLMASLHTLIIASILNMNTLMYVFIGIAVAVVLVGVYVFYINKTIARAKKLAKAYSKDPDYEDA